MPLILLSGYPCSGKTSRASQLEAYFNARLDAALTRDDGADASRPAAPRMTVVVISDHALAITRSAYATAATEKTARATLAAAATRALNQRTIVIVDALCYIKGWRYQMYCEAKAQKTASCVVHVGTPPNQCRQVNEARIAAINASPNAAPLASAAVHAPYDPPVFENLIDRYEEPNGMTRWDSPLFTLLHDDAEPPCQAIWDALMTADGRSRVARPNAATVLPAVGSSDALSALERSSQAVVTSIGSWLKDHPGEGGGVRVDGTNEKVILPADGVALPQLQRLRRQFVALSRSQAAEIPPERMAGIFVAFLNDGWNTSDDALG